MVAFAYLLAALFVSFEFEIVAAQSVSVHSVVWDRFWITQNLKNYTLDVQPGDVIRFTCSVDQFEQRYENIVMLTEENQFSNCNSGTSPQRFIECCQVSGLDVTIVIADNPPLINRPSFRPGETYYFTSFSNGTIDSACNDITGQGGACTLDPPLRLIVNVLTVMSSLPQPPTNVRATVLTPRSVEVTWDQSSSPNVTGYLISYTTTASYASGGNVTVSGNVTSLIFTNLEENTLYTITARATNSDSKVSNSTAVSVTTYTDVPSSPPQNVMVTSIDPGSLMVSWQPPLTIDHNAPIASYVIQYTRVGSMNMFILTVHNKRTTYTISGLVAYVNYSVTVAAVSVNGTGPFNDPVVGRSGVDVPSEPQSLDTISINSNSVTLRWLPPETPNGIITQYSIQVNATVINNFGNNTMGILMGTVEGLSPDTVYVLQLRAHTRVGAGPPSIVTVTTAKEDCSVTNVRGRVKHNQRRKRTTLRFSSDGDPKVMYRCKLDDNRATDCTSPVVWRNLKKGRHTISLRAFCIDDEGIRSTTVRRKSKFRIRS